MTITRTAAVAAFETIKKQGWEVRTASGVEDASLMLEDLAAASDADLASADAQTMLRDALTLTGKAAATVAARTQTAADAVSQNAVARAEAVAAACLAAL